MNINKVLLEQQLGDDHNFNFGRAGHNIDKIIIHTMVGSMNGSQARFSNPNSGVSVQYGIGLSGEIRQWIDEANTAWQAGNWPVNLTSIGIEHEDNGNYNDGGRTDAQYNSSSDLVADICRRYNIPCDRDHILGHNQVIDKTRYPGGTGCPDGLDVERIVREAQSKLNPAPAAPSEPTTAIAAATGKHIHLPASVSSWFIYPLNKLPRIGNQVASLRPNLYGGLDYDVLNWPYANVATIQTEDFGKVNIYVGPDTEATITDDTPAPEAPAPPAAPAPAEPEIPVPQSPAPEPTPTPDDWQKTYLSAQGTFKATKDITVNDLAGTLPDQQLGHDQVVNRAGTVEKDGQTYAITVKSQQSGNWYGIPVTALVPVATPTDYVGKLVQDVKPPKPNMFEEVDNDIDKIAKEISEDPEFQTFTHKLNTRERIIATIAAIEAVMASIIKKLTFGKK